jgi:uncharacterized protein YvpB
MTLLDDLELKAQGLAVMANEFVAALNVYKQSLLADNPAGNASPVKRLDVPWVGQNVGSDDDWSNSDCGPACATMLLRYLGQNVTVNQASKAAGLAKGYKGTAYWDLCKILLAYKVAAGRKAGLSIDKLKAEIDAGKPCILLVHYGSLKTRSDLTFTGGHWILLTGYNVDKQTFLYHDPYFKDSRGRHVEISAIDLEKAMTDCKLDGNTPNQGVFLAAKG